MVVVSRRKTWSIRQRLALLVLVFVVPGVSGMVALFVTDWRQAERDAFERARLIADGVADRVRAELHQRESVLRRLAHRPLVRALDPGRCDPLVAEYITLHPEFTGLDLRDVSGAIVCAYRPNAPGASQVAPQPWFQKALRNPGLGVAGPMVGSRTGRWVSILSHPIADDRGRTAGLALLAMDLLELQERSMGALPDGVIVAVSDGDEKIVLRSRDPQAWLGKPLPRALHGVWRGKDQQRAEGVDGVRRLYADAEIPEAGWRVVAGIPEDDVFAAHRALLLRALVVVALFLGSVLWLAWRVVCSIERPVRALADVAHRVAQGDTAARAPSAGPTEIAAVARQLNRMLDVRDRMDAERAERLRLQEQLRESQKMEAIGTLASGIAHDFNNIMGALLGNLALAQADMEDDHPATNSLRQVHKGALRARALIQQILTYSRRQSQEMANRPLAPLVRDVLDLLRATLPAGVTVELTLPTQPLHVMCDPTQIQQVLLNLCTNAWQAMKGDTGRIEIGLAAVDFAGGGHQRPPGHAADEAVHLWVSDDGKGMDEATRARVFEPFFTTKPVGEGTGLGLSVVHGIVAAHGGAISVQSAPGRGSRFDIHLPRAPVPAAAEEEGRSRMPRFDAAHGEGARVLYVDDDEVMRLMVERLLERDGFRVTTLGDPRAAIALVQAQPRQFDVVVTDYNMPHASGLELVRQLAATRSELPVVLISGLVTDTLRTQAGEAGARVVMHMEKSVEELLPLLRQLIHPVGS
jgi:signal transduction histidine kinase